MARPVYSVRKGALQLAAWPQEGEDKKGYTLKLTRRYKSKQSGEWTDSQYLFESDLLVAAELLRRAWNDLCVKSDAAEAGGSGAASRRAPAAGGSEYVQRGPDGGLRLVDGQGTEIPF